MFAECLERWRLTPDGPPLVTATSRLLPVRRGSLRAMLKIALAPEERAGAAVMAWWRGGGAARVLESDGDALLLERAVAPDALAKMVSEGQDDEATRIICRVAAELHAPRDRPLPQLVPLARWFERLEPAAARHGGVLAHSAAAAAELLASPREVVVLHGDLHHGNVLDFGPRGWLAIDPKGLVGERAFEFVNLPRNPDAGIALTPGRFARQAAIISECAGLDRERFLSWVLAFTGLSAAWLLADGEQPTLDLAVARLALTALADAD